MTCVFLSMGCMMAGLALMMQASNEQNAGYKTEFRAYFLPFHDYVPQRCRVVSIKAVRERETSSLGGCDDFDCYPRIDRFLGVFGVTLTAFEDSRVYAAVLQLSESEKIPSDESKEVAVNQTLARGRLEIGDTVDCGVPRDTRPPLFDGVDEVPADDVAALNFNEETVAAAWKPIRDDFIAGGILLGLFVVVGLCAIMGALCMCGCIEFEDKKMSRQQRERDFVQGTLSRNTCDYGVLSWLGWCCFRTFGGTFEDVE